MILAGNIGLAHASCLIVIVKRVKAENQVAKLQEMGRDLAEGSHFAEPLPSEAIQRQLVEVSPYRSALRAARRQYPRKLNSSTQV